MYVTVEHAHGGRAPLRADAASHCRNHRGPDRGGGKPVERPESQQRPEPPHNRHAESGACRDERASDNQRTPAQPVAERSHRRFEARFNQEERGEDDPYVGRQAQFLHVRRDGGLVHYSVGQLRHSRHYAQVNQRLVGRKPGPVPRQILLQLTLRFMR